MSAGIASFRIDGRQAAVGLSTEWIMATSGSVRRTLFRCKWPIKCQRIGRSARAAAFSQSCWGRLSPRSVQPASTNGRTRSADDVFGHGHQPDVVGRAARASGGGGNLAAHPRDVLGDSRRDVRHCALQPPLR